MSTKFKEDTGIKIRGVQTEKPTTVVDGDLVLSGDETRKGHLEVKGSIIGSGGARYSLRVEGDLTVNGAIHVNDLTAANVYAKRGIDARHIDAGDIGAGHINANQIKYDLICIAIGDIKCRSAEGNHKDKPPLSIKGELQLE
jgi:cytoskeletal protein CcmA (bactofilin family)